MPQENVAAVNKPGDAGRLGAVRRLRDRAGQFERTRRRRLAGRPKAVHEQRGQRGSGVPQRWKRPDSHPMPSLAGWQAAARRQAANRSIRRRYSRSRPNPEPMTFNLDA